MATLPVVVDGLLLSVSPAELTALRQLDEMMRPGDIEDLARHAYGLLCYLVADAGMTIDEAAEHLGGCLHDDRYRPHLGEVSYLARRAILRNTVQATRTLIARYGPDGRGRFTFDAGEAL